MCCSCNYLDTSVFHFGSREVRRQKLLENYGFLCECSECSLEGEDLEDNDRMRADMKEMDVEIRQLLTACEESHAVPWRELKKAMKLAQKKTNLVQKLNIRSMFVTEMINFFFLASNAQMMGITAPDPNIFKSEALKYAKI